MNPVVMERVFSPPVSEPQIREMMRDGTGCLARYRVQHRGSLVGEKGSRVTCFYEAPDAESVRIANRQGHSPFERAWTATVHGPETGACLPSVPASVACVVVERAFAAPVAFQELQAREESHGWCLSAHRVEFLRSYLSVDRRRMICLYTAPDAEAVRTVQVTAGLPFDRIWSAGIIRAEA